MPNSQETKEIKSDVTGGEQPREYRPVASPELFDKLEYLMKHLNAYYIGYTSSLELSDLCVKTERKLGISLEEGETRVSKSDFWELAQESHDNAYETINGLPDLILEDKKIKETIKTFKEHLSETNNCIKARQMDPRGASCGEVARDALRSFGILKLNSKDIKSRSKIKVKSLLEEMDRVITSIRNLISITDKNAGEPRWQPRSVAVKTKTEQTEAIQQPQPLESLEETTPSQGTSRKID